MDEIVDARKEKFDRDEAWNLLKNADRIFAARGKKFREFSPGSDDREALLKAVLGPSGNLRAPALKVKEGFLVGFNPDLYDEWLHGRLFGE